MYKRSLLLCAYASRRRVIFYTDKQNVDSFYHDFFSKHAASELTREIFCRADEVLFEKSTGFDLQKLKDKGVFQVDGTLASEGNTCRFIINKGRGGGGGLAGGGTARASAIARKGSGDR